MATLRLQAHPEGGYFAEVYRTDAVTTIYFLLTAGQKSRWHRVRAEEIWHHYEGAAVDLFQLTPDGEQLQRFTLGPLSDTQQPVHCVPADCWQAAQSLGPYSLVGCTVAPAFRYEDFALLSETPRLAAEVARRHPAVADFL